MMTTQLKIRYYGDPCLRLESDPVKEVGPGERLLAEAMIKTMYASKGIGLAAPQVGINQQFFVADIGLGPFAVFNPKIVKRFGQESMEEGCLCLPGVSVNVRRAKEIKVRYRDENNQIVEKELAGMAARVFMHETDHLHGKLIIDYAGWRQRRRIKDQVEKIANGDIPLERESSGESI
jgi:peptide deformylase